MPRALHDNVYDLSVVTPSLGTQNYVGLAVLHFHSAVHSFVCSENVRQARVQSRLQHILQMLMLSDLLKE